MNDSLGKIVMDMMVELRLLEESTQGINDYGEPTGFSRQESNIHERLKRYCLDVKGDARDMRHRIAKWHQQQIELEAKEVEESEK